MQDIYFHIHTPVNVEEDNKYLFPPVLSGGNLYVINEKKLIDAFIFIGYYPEYVRFIRECGFENISKFLSKKKLLNGEFLESISKYWLEDVHLKNVSNYKYFQKNEKNIPVISEKYIKNIFTKVILYNHIKNNYDKFNEKLEKELNIIENELSSIKDPKSLNTRQIHYRKNIFEIILDNFLDEFPHNIKEIFDDINNINIKCESTLNWSDLFIFKTSNINEYKNFNFRLTNSAHTECLRENTFLRFHVDLPRNKQDEEYTRYLLDKIKICSQQLTGDKVEFGVSHLKRIIERENANYIKKLETMKHPERVIDDSNIAILQKSQTLISETEDHMVYRYSSLKYHTNIYLAPLSEVTAVITALNTDKENLKRLNSIIWQTPNKIESDLTKFTFKTGNLPYSAYGYASLNF